MLFTRCPDCQTNFRITADALRKADGQVKCGHCKNVFNAYEELRNDNAPDRQPTPPVGPTREPFDSLSETDEYVALDDDLAFAAASVVAGDETFEDAPVVADDETFEDTSVVADDESSEVPSLIADDEIFEDTSVDEDFRLQEPLPVDDGDLPRIVDPSEPGKSTFEEPGTYAHSEPLEDTTQTEDETIEPQGPRVEVIQPDIAPFPDVPLSEAEELQLAERLRAETSADEEGSRPGNGDLATETEPSLEFNLPENEWSAFFEHVAKEPLADGLPQGGGISRPDDDRVQPATEPAGEIVIKEVVDTVEEAADTTAPEGDDAGEDQSRGAEPSETDGATAPTLASPSPTPVLSPELGDVSDEIDSVEDTTAREEEGAAGKALAVDGLFAQPLKLVDKVAPHRWGIASMVFLLFLVFQIVHYFRAPLSGQPVVGPLLRATYSMTGTELSPDWDLSQYVIMDWVATADAETEGPGSLEIRARIHNRGPRAQPYPRVRLELKDRWEATVGSRIFTAEEYLPGELTNERIMDAGSTVPARLEVVDPGQDAYGFELDICAELNAGGLRCASDNVFQ